MGAQLQKTISQPHAIEILLTVGDNPGIGKSSLVSGEGRGAKIIRVKELMDAGLLIEHSCNIGRISKTYTLSEDGMRFYRLWRQFESGGDLPTDYDTSLAQGAEAK